jgi:lipopolysaccharide transport system ATP-binding protein
MEPDVLLIDEVLAVGDVGFRAKCFSVISKISKNSSIIFVSHHMPQISNVCNKVNVMNHGKSVYQGKDVPKGIGYYYSNFDTQKESVTGNGKATLHRTEFESKGKMGVDQINYLDDLTVHLDITVDPEIKNVNVGILVWNQEQLLVAECFSLYNKKRLHNTGDLMHIAIKFAEVNLNPSIYSLSVVISDEDNMQELARYYYVKDLKISGDFIGYALVQLAGEWELNEETIT